MSAVQDNPGSARLSGFRHSDGGHRFVTASRVVAHHRDYCHAGNEFPLASLESVLAGGDLLPVFTRELGMRDGR